MLFKELKLKARFRFNGTTFIKKSSRTAYVADMGDRFFYFSGGDVVSTKIPKRGEQDEKGYY